MILNKNQIKEIALANGFKLKEQPNGNMDLNPYVYVFAQKLIDFLSGPIKINDKVILNSGGPIMIVVNIIENTGELVCIWRDDDNRYTSTVLPVACVYKVDE